MKNVFYLFLILLICGCSQPDSQTDSMMGYYYSTNDMFLNRTTVLLKKDSIILLDTVRTFNISTGQRDLINPVYLRVLKNTSNQLTGTYTNGNAFSGYVNILKNGMKIYSHDSTFICEVFNNSLDNRKFFDEFNKKRLNYFSKLSDSKKIEYIFNIIYSSNLKITVNPSVNQSLSTIPNGSGFVPFVDYTTLKNLSFDREDVDVFLTDFFDILNKKTPLVLRISERPISISGNRFEDGGLSRRDIGKTYHYGNYSYDNILRKEFQFYYLDILSNSIIETGIGYIIDNSNGQLKRDGQLIPYSFYSQQEIQKNTWVKIFEKINTKLSQRRLKYLQATNAGVFCYFDDGTMYVCPRCDFENINKYTHSTPTGIYSEKDIRDEIKNSMYGWVIIDYDLIK